MAGLRPARRAPVPPVTAVDRDSPVAPYQQVAAALRAQIKRGKLKPGDRIPSIEQICATFGVARTTARKAVAVLVDEGLAEVTTGWGTFVRRPDRPAR